ncbi:MAG: GAF domain-containing protein [Ignavibacteria bacterium]
MEKTITISPKISKEEKYKSLLPQIKSLIEDETNSIANLSNICAALKYNMDDFFWVGFYFVQGNVLVVGPYQGPLACTRIKLYNGVCGASVKEKNTIIVDDVNKFPGHIACSTDSKSEIVIPILRNNEVFAVLDIDSDKYANFDNIDKIYLEKLVNLTYNKL